MTARKRTPGITRIDRKENHTYGFSARLTRKGKFHAKFFADSLHGGRRRAFEAAQKHYRKLLRIHGVMTPQRLAQIPRRKNATGIVGVQKFIVKKRGRQLVYWRAVWSPRPNVVRKQTFSPRLYGARRAKALAIRARNKGVRSMGACPEAGTRRQGSRSREGKSPRSKP